MYDIVIIGGGISGLYTYMKLSKMNKYKILLLEKNNYFGGRILEIIDDNISFPAGAARFNKNHVKVIKLLKEFNLIDFRKNSGFNSNIEFIDSKNNFSSKFDNKNGFIFINKLIKQSSKFPSNFLKQLSFKEYANLCIEKDEIEFMLIASGYSGQLNNMNAYDAIQLFKYGIRVDIKYWNGKYNLLINKIVEYLKKNNESLKLNSFVSNIQFVNEKNLYKIKYNNTFIHSKQIILSLPKPALLKLSILKPIYPILQDSISCKSLCRTYAVFDKKDIWFDNIKNKVVTNNQLRYIIPINIEKGLIMISYTDYKYTKYWKNIENNQTKLKEAVVKMVNSTFNIKINPPRKVYVCYWECGVAYWNKGYDSNIISDFVLNPLPNIYICGENYSKYQSWVEGAIDSSDKCLDLINKR